jgi:hypothetical protein
VLYTTNAIESVNYTIQKIIKHRQSFPNDEAAMKLIFMGLKNISKEWTVCRYGIGGQPSINSQSFMGKTGFPYDLPFTQKNLQVP